MTRRSTGGTIDYHAPRNLWRARYVGADGRRHALYAKTRREAQERLRAALRDADHGIRPVGQQLTAAAGKAQDMAARLTRLEGRAQ